MAASPQRTPGRSPPAPSRRAARRPAPVRRGTAGRGLHGRLGGGGVGRDRRRPGHRRSSRSRPGRVRRSGQPSIASEVGHRGVGVEGRLVGADRRAGVIPAEVGLVGRGPHLQRLRGRRCATPSTIRRHSGRRSTSVGGHVRHHAERHGQHDDVEVLAGHAARSAPRWRGRTSGLGSCRHGASPPDGGAEAREAADAGERVAPRRGDGLRRRGGGGHGRSPSSSSTSSSRRWKSSNCDASGLQRLVERREHHLAHAGLHLPEDRALDSRRTGARPGTARARPRSGADRARRPRRRTRGRRARGRTASRASPGRTRPASHSRKSRWSIRAKPSPRSRPSATAPWMQPSTRSASCRRRRPDVRRTRCSPSIARTSSSCVEHGRPRPGSARRPGRG